MVEESSGYECRITIRLLGYWEKKRGMRRMASEADIDPADIADLWEYCFIARARDTDKRGHNFSYLGKAIADVYREGLDTRDVAFPNMDELANGYKQVISKGEPLVTEGEITNPHGDVFKYRQVLLPLGEGSRVDAVFGGMRFLRVISYK